MIFDKDNPKPYIKSVAIEATRWAMTFNDAQKECEFFRLNQVTKEKNCFHGNTLTRCDLFICPLKGEP